MNINSWLKAFSPAYGVYSAYHPKGEKGVPEGFNRVSTLDPQQKAAFEQLLGMLSGGRGLQLGQNYLEDILSGSPEAFEKFEAPYKRQFQEEIIPGIAERFSGAGAGAQSSSAFQQALGGAGADLSERLASLREGLRLQASSRPFDQLSQLLGMQTQAFIPKQKPFWQSLIESLSGGIGQAGGAYAAGKFLPKI